MTTVTEADRERALLIRRGTTSCGHGMWYPIDCEDCLAEAFARAREVDEAKGRAKAEHLLKANQAMSQDAVDWSRILNLPLEPIETLSRRIGAAILSLVQRAP